MNGRLTLPCVYTRVTQGFGEHPEWYAAYGLAGHEGLDLSVPVGTPVHAAHDGVAQAVWGSPTYGHHIIVRGDWCETLYAHLSEVRAHEKEVRAGDIIGLSGNTGRTTGPHLHVGLRIYPPIWTNGYKGYVDPLPYFGAWNALEETTMPWKIGWHLGNKRPLTDIDWCILRTCPPACVTFLTGEAIETRDLRALLQVNPHLTVIARPYYTPQPYSLTGAQSYMDLCVRHLEPLLDVVPAGQLWLQPYNEPNMPRHAAWEGFGDTPADMDHYNDAFLTALCGVRGRFGRRVKVGWGALTPGNRDWWWPGDPEGVHYYLHGPEAAVPGATAAARMRAAQDGLCAESIRAADGIFAHTYIHNEPLAYKLPWLGLRHRMIQHFWPDKPLYITECGFPRRDLWPHWGDGALLEWLRGVQEDPGVAGVTLWVLGDAPEWGAMWYHGGAPRAVVGEITRLHGEVTGQGPSTAEVEREIGLALQQGIVPLNPWAAFEQAGSALGMLPAGPETDVMVGTAEYRAQAYRDARQRDLQYICYARLGEWGNLKWFTWQN